MNLRVSVICIFAFCCCYVSAEEGKITVKPHTLRLKEDLLCAYDKSVRPVYNHGDVTFVFATMLLRSLTFDEHSSSLSIRCWMVWEWLDMKLQWNPSDYGAVDDLLVDSSEIWVPEVSHFGLGASGYVKQKIHAGLCQVNSSGMVTCVSPTVYNALCAPDVTYWPNDKLECSLQLGAWMQAGDEITVNTNNGIVNMFHYERNPEWKLLSADSRRHLETLSVNMTLPWIHYSFSMQRHSTMYKATVGVPALVLASLVLLAFWLPPLDENRINMSCVCLVCHCLYLMFLGWKLENAMEKSPLIVQLYRDSLVLSGLSLVASIALRCLNSTSATPPDWISGVTRWILSYRPGQILLLLNISPKVAATTKEDGSEEESELVGMPPADGVHSWTLFGTLVDRVFFLVSIFVYLIIFVKCFT